MDGWICYRPCFPSQLNHLILNNQVVIHKYYTIILIIYNKPNNIMIA